MNKVHEAAKPALKDSSMRVKRRPTITAPRPWDSEGMSRRTWYRRRQAERKAEQK